MSGLPGCHPFPLRSCRSSCYAGCPGENHPRVPSLSVALPTSGGSSHAPFDGNAHGRRFLSPSTSDSGVLSEKAPTTCRSPLHSIRLSDSDRSGAVHRFPSYHFPLYRPISESFRTGTSGPKLPCTFRFLQSVRAIPVSSGDPAPRRTPRFIQNSRTLSSHIRLLPVRDSIPVPSVPRRT